MTMPAEDLNTPVDFEPVALVDLDGTLADYDAAMERDMEPLAGPDEVLNHRSNEPHIKARQQLVRMKGGWWRDLAPLPVGFEILQALRDTGYDLHILTKGPFKALHAYSEKAEWCRKHVPDAKIVISEDKGLVYGRVLVDDWPPYIERWLKWRPRGLIIMPAQPWNIGFGDNDPRIIRYCGGGQPYAGNKFRPPQFGGLQVYSALCDALKERNQ